MVIGNYIIDVINFLEYPTWHLVIFYVIILAILAFNMVKSWFADYFKW